MKKNLLTILLAAALSGVMLVGCGSNNSSGTTSSAPAVSGASTGELTSNPFASATPAEASVPTASTVDTPSVPEVSAGSESSIDWGEFSMDDGDDDEDSFDWGEFSFDDGDDDEDSFDWGEFSFDEDSDEEPSLPVVTQKPTVAELKGSYKMGVSDQFISSLTEEQQAQVRQIVDSSSMTINADGTLTATSMGQSGTGTWTINDNGTITLSLDGSTTTGIYNNGMIYDPNDMSTYFIKQ